jgi:5-formyltetrahydrofolate cyclo-ligase
MTGAPDSAEVKVALRRRFRALRQAQPPGAELVAALDVVEHLRALIGPRSTVAAFAAFDREIAIDEALFSTAHCWNLAFPVMAKAGRSMFFARASERPALPGRLGIREPSPEDPVPVDQIDAFLVPGLAFSPIGARLGFGGGFYDRFLATARPDALLIGIAFEWQICHAVPIEDHDVCMTHIVTPRQTIDCAARLRLNG